MGGLFGAVSTGDCVTDVYFGTDYHSHLGTSKGGMAFWTKDGFNRSIHNIENTQFRAKFEAELSSIKSNMGIGCISDTEPQPLTVRSHLCSYAISTVGKINNTAEIIKKAFQKPNIHLLEINKGQVNQTELVSVIVDNEKTFKDGLLAAQELIDGSCSVLLMTPEGIYAARDKLGRTPLIVGKKEESREAIMMMYLHGGNWQKIKEALEIIGAPTTAEGAGLSREEIIQALVKAHDIKPERYTILGYHGLTEDAAEKLAESTGVI